MFQTFTPTTTPEQGPPRLAKLRDRMEKDGIDGFIVPRADAHQGEYVAPCDERLAWLTGFTGSAGFCIALKDKAGVFVDGRYRVQVKEQVDTDHFTPVAWPETKPHEWLKDMLSEGVIAFDPWLFTKRQIDEIRAGLDGSSISLRPSPNLIDAIWDDRPPRPSGKVEAYPLELSGKPSSEKRAETAALLKDAGHRAAVLTLPDSIAWLLNIRGSDIARIPIVQCFAIVYDTAKVDLFIDATKLSEIETDPDITILPNDGFEAALTHLSGPVRVDAATAPLKVSDILTEGGVEIAYADDPCILPKARKNPVEIDGTRSAHLRDAKAMIDFLAWLDRQPAGGFTEIDAASALEGFRTASNTLRDISFETISGSGPNGAIVHYRVTEDSNRTVIDGDLLLVDSGGQYVDGTTDITRTIAIGSPTDEQKACFTRVLQGMIAISRARFPVGLSGRDLDALARAPLWMAGLDYDHGTGHGVGVYLSVHEGPQRLSRQSETKLQPGMILSNEPGYYREGAFGIRIENLIVVEPAPDLPGGDHRDMLSFETLTYVPIDRRLIATDLLSPGERSWIDDYHADILKRVTPSPEAEDWLKKATAPL
ncbi:aminopeptidase P family protein [Litoreibacter roseus]|uniref:Xaa-Pro aminopeptidase n=1 Tax=Litoreibacter roseus TaxID=2601869 RepID=A0A6N6JDV4_9RHOB|nr:aminopeptidase P family protein [Litoreibacter roseus]GFE63569.1 Xaa-Pro aminopeptidase [Litoreibacter roseus]